jgi:hypothetical protein
LADRGEVQVVVGLVLAGRPEHERLELSDLVLNSRLA